MIDMTDVVKRYTLGGETIYALNHISLHVDKGEYVAIIGPSGSGKSTLMNIIGCLDTADSGSYMLNDKPIQKYRERQLARIRNRQIGFIFQGFNLLPKLSALENVELANEICRQPLDAKQTLESVGLGERMKNFPAQLSGGEQQRVAIARAIAKNPKILLCDEPTGALDYETGKNILGLLQKICRESGKTVIIITHTSELSKMADHVFGIKNGKIAFESRNDNPIPVEELVW